MSVAVSITAQGGLRLAWQDGVTRDIDPHWLFDHTDEARNPVSGQRSHGALELADVRLSDARIDGDRIQFRFAPSGLHGSIGLARLCRAETGATPGFWPTPDPIERTEPVPFDAYLKDDASLREALARVARFGLVRLDGAGTEPGTVERAVERFGFVRETNYGRLFDVRIEPSPTNLAFSDRGLDFHTDNPYRDPTPTLQLLHALVADRQGGETLFVDGFAQAERLREETPGAFETLSRTPVGFRYGDRSGACWTAEAPIIELDASGAVRAIRLNHRALDLSPDIGGPWYDAYLAFHRLVHEPGAAFERVLRPGEMVIFDNRRLLHGRGGLRGGSPRWLQGCYADRDGLRATLARLEASNPGPTR